MGSVVGAITGHSKAKSTNKANAAYAADLNGVRNQIRDVYAEAQKGWVDYIPELQQGISGNINLRIRLQGGILHIIIIWETRPRIAWVWDIERLRKVSPRN